MTHLKKYYVFFITLAVQVSFFPLNSAAQPESSYWQQHVSYAMEIDMDTEKHQMDGKQTLVYTNNSPDVLDKVYYHLYFNAFQPNSMMDARSRSIEDPDGRVKDRIYHLKDNEIGYHKVDKLTQDGKKVKYQIDGTIMTVELAQPIQPGKSATFEMEFNSQVPVQIRRSGRDNKEGIDYSMAQWYPKMVEYDRDGWHTNPYVGREFHGVFGEYDVKIKIDESYTIGGTGILQNAEQIGHGYSDNAPEAAKGSKLTWHFKANNVHDFAWAADPEYQHDMIDGPDGFELHFFYQTDSMAKEWKDLQPYTFELFRLMNNRFGKYPYKQFSVVQGGDGGMEYPMSTLITSHGSMAGLVSVTVHEAIHNWYYGILATNESKHPWMDEGFTSFAQYEVLDSLYGKNSKNPHSRAFSSYRRLAQSGKDEPLSTHADFYDNNYHYGVNSYRKGQTFVQQLRYIVGEEPFWKGMKTYFEEWKFKHPTPQDFKRVMERESGLELDWYFENWLGTTKKIDYAIRDVQAVNGKTVITVERKGNLPMPIEVTLETADKSTTHYIPLRIMRGTKQFEEKGVVSHTPWPWTHPIYQFEVSTPVSEIESVELDVNGHVADINLKNDQWPKSATPIFRDN